jgi:hypothetical protein
VAYCAERTLFLIQIGLQQEIPAPEQGPASAIAQAYRRASEAAVAKLSANWTDKTTSFQSRSSCSESSTQRSQESWISSSAIRFIIAVKLRS